MKLTNNRHVPDALYGRMLEGVYEPDPKRVGATTLIDAPMKRHLKLEHWDDLVEDASDRLWALLGNAFHAYLEGHEKVCLKLYLETHRGAVTEERFEYKHPLGLLLVAYPDLYRDETVRDYKVTSTWAYIYKKDFAPQINVNAELIERAGLTVKKGVIDMFMRDFQTAKAGIGDYPQSPFQSIKVPIWDKATRNAFIDKRMAMHTSDNVPLCSAEEMWEKPTTYAVKGKNRKSAFRVLDSMEKAEKWKEDNGKGDYIETRPGERTCCKSYCGVRSVCPFNIYGDKQ